MKAKVVHVMTTLVAEENVLFLKFAFVTHVNWTLLYFKQVVIRKFPVSGELTERGNTGFVPIGGEARRPQHPGSSSTSPQQATRCSSNNSSGSTPPNPSMMDDPSRRKQVAYNIRRKLEEVANYFHYFQFSLVNIAGRINHSRCFSDTLVP